MHERIIGLYEGNATARDLQRGRDLDERAWLERFATLLPEGGTMLDIGCGMGEPIGRWLDFAIPTAATRTLGSRKPEPRTWARRGIPVSNRQGRQSGEDRDP